MLYVINSFIVLHKFIPLFHTIAYAFRLLHEYMKRGGIFKTTLQLAISPDHTDITKHQRQNEPMHSFTTYQSTDHADVTSATTQKQLKRILHSKSGFTE